MSSVSDEHQFQMSSMMVEPVRKSELSKTHPVGPIIKNRSKNNHIFHLIGLSEDILTGRF